MLTSISFRLDFILLRILTNSGVSAFFGDILTLIFLTSDSIVSTFDGDFDPDFSDFLGGFSKYHYMNTVHHQTIFCYVVDIL